MGITVEGTDFIVKFRKMTESGLLVNHFSEYLGSHVFQLVGLDAQDTYLGVYKGKEAVIMRDFTSPHEQFVPFNDVGDSTLEEDKERFHYSYDDIMAMLEDNRKLTDVSETISVFWQMYLVDALIGNFDRHGGNWGFLKKDNKYRMAPIFDNGSSFFRRLSTDEDLRKVLDDADEMRKRVFRFPVSQIRIGNKKSSYYDVISSLRFPACNRALLKIVPSVDLGKIGLFIESVPEWSPTRKEFYKSVLRARYEGLLKGPYEALCKKTN
ncbi:MAG: HipA domain-containing protein [Bacilli bacterium]|nr:HipA domain-containing protein [Bacilli bacterium]